MLKVICLLALLMLLKENHRTRQVFTNQYTSNRPNGYPVHVAYKLNAQGF